MVQCKFFARGYCKYGSYCKFEHGSQQPNGRRDDTSYASNSHQSPQPQRYFGGQPSQPVRQSYFGGQTQQPVRSQPYFGAQAQQPVRQSYFGGQAQQPVRQSYFGQQQQPARQSNPDQLSYENQQYLSLVEKDSLDWEHGNQWPFSVYAPLLRRVLTSANRQTTWEENVPGFFDISQEELRWEAMEAHARGQFEDYLANIQSLSGKVQHIRRALQKMDQATGRFIIGFERGENVSPAGTALDLPNVPPTAAPVSVQQPEKKSFSFSLPAGSAPPPSAAASSFSFKLPAQQPQQPLFQQPAFQQTAFQQPAVQIQPQTQAPTPIFQQQAFGSQPAFQQPSSFQQGPSSSSGADNDPSLGQSDLEQFKADKFSFGRIPRNPPPKNLR